MSGRSAPPVVRRWRRAALIVAMICVALLLLVAAFPWGWLAGRAAGPLSRAIGRPVTIGGARRVDHLSFVPTIELRDVTVGQPAWAGGGTMARIAVARARIPIIPLLWGDLRLRSLEMSGVRAELRRTAAGRANWAGDAKTPRRKQGGIDLSLLTLRDVRVHLIDAKRHLDVAAALRSDESGLAARGQGRFRGVPITLALDGAALTGGSTHDYPATLRVTSSLVSFEGKVRMARALSLDRFTGQVSARGRDLAYLDDLIEAGLFPTQPFDLTGAIGHADDSWTIDRLRGRIGRSRLDATLRVKAVGERTRLEGRIAAATLDFGDFASDAQHARGLAEAKATGPRVIPDASLDLDGVAKLDGALSIDAKRLVSRHPSPLRALKAEVSLDDRRLTIAPLAVPLSYGVARGRVVIDDRGALPKLSADLRITGATIDGLLLGDTAVTGPLTARIRLNGSGRTLRDAAAAGWGQVGLVVRGGSMRRDYATFLGGDLFKSVGVLVSGGDGRVPVRCLTARFVLGNRRLTPSPLVLDATIARGDGTGAIRLPDEQIDLSVRGRAAKPGVIQSSTPVLVIGSLSDPKIDIRPPRAAKRGKTGLLDRVGAFIKGLKTKADNPEPARPADCARLAREALG